jgi:hypothetical protein
MRLLFSEAPPDAAHYLYPYAVWGFLEPGETPADAFAAGFLPGTAAVDRFYLVRQLRVPLKEWKATSENRRVLRKGSSLTCALIPRAEFEFSAQRRAAWLAYSAERFGPGVMSGERLDRLMAGRVISHVLQFTDGATGAEAGTVLLYLQAPRIAFYYFAFYPFSPETRHVGMAMMTRAVEWFAAAGYDHLHLGTCYTERALYKTQFEPVEFFNGFRWSRNREELKRLLAPAPDGRHRLEEPEFLALQPEPLAGLAAGSPFRRPL